jgi:uncharacterized phage protein gp47/JayE
MTWLVLITTITSAELQASLLATMTTAGLPTTSWTRDGFWQNFVNWIALLLRLVFEVLNNIARNSFLSTATEQGLIDLGEGTYGTPYRRETFATGTVTLLNESGAPLDEVIEAISFGLIADPEVTYKNSEAVYAMNGAEVTFDIVCDVAGTVGNAAAGVGGGVTIELVTTLTGVSLVANSAIIGQDEQGEDQYRDLCTKQAASASTGHANKYEWFALNTNTDGTIAEVDDGKTRVNVNRVFVSFEDAFGRVYVALASPSGSVDSAEYDTTIAVLTQYALTNPGILIDANATAVPVNVVADVVLRKGTSTSGVSAEIEARLETYFPDTSIGGDDGFLTREELRLEIGRANPRIHAVTVTTPASDVALAADEVATLGTVTLNITVQA